MTPDGKPSRSRVRRRSFLSRPQVSAREQLPLWRLNLQKYLLIAIGGALGSVTRYLVGSIVANRMGTRFPYGTFVINLTACLIIGFSLTVDRTAHRGQSGMEVPDPDRLRGRL